MFEDLFGKTTPWAVAAVLLAVIAGTTYYNVNHDNARNDLRAEVVKSCSNMTTQFMVLHASGDSDPASCIDKVLKAANKK